MAERYEFHSGFFGFYAATSQPLRLCLLEYFELRVPAFTRELSCLKILATESLVHALEASPVESERQGDASELTWVRLNEVIERRGKCESIRSFAELSAERLQRAALQMFNPRLNFRDFTRSGERMTREKGQKRLGARFSPSRQTHCP